MHFWKKRKQNIIPSWQMKYHVLLLIETNCRQVISLFYKESTVNHTSHDIFFPKQNQRECCFVKGSLLPKWNPMKKCHLFNVICQKHESSDFMTLNICEDVRLIQGVYIHISNGTKCRTR